MPNKTSVAMGLIGYVRQRTERAPNLRVYLFVEYCGNLRRETT
jgi:hypothetical protein